jgi:hypothetical protein
MRRHGVVFPLLALALFARAAQAGPIANTTGLSSPNTTITFSELSFALGAPITSEFSAYGVVFSPSGWYDAQGVTSCCNGIVADYIANFTGPPAPISNPWSILFTADQTEVAFALATNPGTATFTALLGGTPVESFSSSTSFNSSTPYYFGFTGITFDEIRISVGGDQVALIDNIQLGSAAVPEPHTFALIASALFALALARRRRAG